MPEPMLLLASLAVAAVVVLAPLLARAAPPAADDRDAVVVRHRVALEALRDIEADRRAGSLDDAAYHRQRAEAERWAAASAAALANPSHGGDVASRRFDHRGRTAAIAAAAAIGIALLAGSAVPGSGIANQTVHNQALADSQAAEATRQERIGELLDAFAADPQDAATLSALADAYLAGTELEDLARAASALQLLIGLEPNRADAYERIIGAYLRAGDAANARAAHDAYAALPTADQVEVAFFDGLIALEGEADPDRARAAFDRFLELAPDDPRASMIRALREEAAAD